MCKWLFELSAAFHWVSTTYKALETGSESIHSWIPVASWTTSPSSQQLPSWSSLPALFTELVCCRNNWHTHTKKAPFYRWGSQSQCQRPCRRSSACKHHPGCNYCGPRLSHWCRLSWELLLRLQGKKGKEGVQEPAGNCLQGHVQCLTNLEQKCYQRPYQVVYCPMTISGTWYVVACK